MFELIVKVGLRLTCGMTACIICILQTKKEQGFAIVSIVDVIIVIAGPISIGIICMIGLSKINIRI